jgi:hypothetical protein
MRSGIEARVLFGAIIALLAAPPDGCAAGSSSKSKPGMTAETVNQEAEKKANRIQLVTFPDTGWSPVKVVRRGAPAKDEDAQKPTAEKAEIAELVTFGDRQNTAVRVVRGETDRAPVMPVQPRRAHGMNMELVTFADPRDRPVSILRGSVYRMADTELFDPASVADLDRVAFAVDGAESSHGADVRMWRPEASGPQGPMQITAAAATDVGGGDRFDIAENRLLGRAYLARMYGRYGNWPDAIAAYNWGPSNLDLWIGGGRAVDEFPLEVERYRNRVLRDAALAGRGTMMLSSGWPFRTAAPRDAPREGLPPAVATVDAVAVLNALDGTAAPIHEIIAAVRTRAANWKTAYSALGDRITLLIGMRRPPPEEATEYAVSAETAD